MASVNALSVALFNASAGGYSADMVKNPAAYAAAVGAVLEKDLSSDAAFVAHLLSNFGIATSNAVYAEAQAALTGLVNASGRANATVAAIDFLAAQTVGSAYAAIATAFQAKVTAAAAFSAANATETDVSKLIAAVTGVDTDAVAAAASFAAGAASRDTEVADLEVEVAGLEEELAAAQAAAADAAEAAAAELAAAEAEAVTAAEAAAAELAAAEAAAAEAAAAAAAEIAALEAEVEALENPAGGSFVLTTSTSNVILGVAGGNDSVTGTASTYQTGDFIVDASSADNDTLTVSLTAANTATPTVLGFENVVFNVTSFAQAEFDADNIRATTLTVNQLQTGGSTNADIDNVATGMTVVAGSGITGTLDVDLAAGGSTINGGSALTGIPPDL